MKNLVKISLLAVCIGIFASGCSGCGDRTKTTEETAKAAQDSPAKTKAVIDTVKKDTSKKK